MRIRISAKKTVFYILIFSTIKAISKEKVVICGTKPPTQFEILSTAVFGHEMTMKKILSREWIPIRYLDDDCIKENRPRLSQPEAVKWCNSMYASYTIEQEVKQAEKR
jgi:hypothetical protein